MPAAADTFAPGLGSNAVGHAHWGRPEQRPAAYQLQAFLQLVSLEVQGQTHPYAFAEVFQVLVVHLDAVGPAPLDGPGLHQGAGDQQDEESMPAPY